MEKDEKVIDIIAKPYNFVIINQQKESTVRKITKMLEKMNIKYMI